MSRVGRINRVYQQTGNQIATLLAVLVLRLKMWPLSALIFFLSVYFSLADVGKPLLHRSSDTGPARFHWKMAYDESRILVIVHNPSDTEVFYFNGNKSYNASSFYKDRVGIVNVTDDAVAFSLKNVTLADAGSYTCREHSKLTLIPDCGQYLYYLDEDTFPVLPDQCQLVARYEGQTVSLLCVVEFSLLPAPRQGYTWTFSARGSQATTQRGETGINLTLSSLSRGHTGSYSCENVDPTYTGKTSGKSSIYLDVTVSSPVSPQTSATLPTGAQSDPGASSNGYMIAFYTIFAVNIVAIIVIFICWKRNYFEITFPREGTPPGAAASDSTPPPEVRPRVQDEDPVPPFAERRQQEEDEADDSHALQPMVSGGNAL